MMGLPLQNRALPVKCAEFDASRPTLRFSELQ